MCFVPTRSLHSNKAAPAPSAHSTATPHAPWAPAADVHTPKHPAAARCTTLTPRGSRHSLDIHMLHPTSIACIPLSAHLDPFLQVNKGAASRQTALEDLLKTHADLFAEHGLPLVAVIGAAPELLSSTPEASPFVKAYILHVIVKGAVPLEWRAQKLSFAPPKCYSEFTSSLLQRMTPFVTAYRHHLEGTDAGVDPPVDPVGDRRTGARGLAPCGGGGGWHFLRPSS